MSRPGLGRDLLVGLGLLTSFQRALRPNGNGVSIRELFCFRILKPPVFNPKTNGVRASYHAMQRRPPFVFFVPRFPWWGWILLLPLLVLGVFLGALFLLVFLVAGLVGALAFWVRWKWLVRKSTGRGAHGVVCRDGHAQKGYDYDLHKLDDTFNDRK